MENCETKEQYLEVLNSCTLPFKQELIYKLGSKKIRVSIRSIFINTHIDIDTIKEAIFIRHTDYEDFLATTGGSPYSYGGNAFGPNAKKIIPIHDPFDHNFIAKKMDPDFVEFEGILSGSD